MSKKPDYDAIAKEIMFSPKTFSLTKHGVVFRKGKTVDDINHALRKARKNGMHKTEFEISMMELYIKDVLKAAPASADE